MREQARNLGHKIASIHRFWTVETPFSGGAAWDGNNNKVGYGEIEWAALRDHVRALVGNGRGHDKHD